jgi:hypothetical protein
MKQPLPAAKAHAKRTSRAPICQAAPWLALLLAACSDPGTGGTGIPGPTAGAEAPAPSPAPIEAPPPDALGPAAPPPGCTAPPAASSDPYTGLVRALADGCLLVGDRAIVITMATIQRRSGAAATAADLVPGIRVTVAPQPADPGRADAVVIEDTGI